MEERDRISVSFGRTINTGSYESTRIDASIATSNGDNLNELYDKVKSFVDGKEREIRTSRNRR